MVRLMLVLAPVMCILAGIGVSSMLNTYMQQIDDEVKIDRKKSRFEGNYFMRSKVSILTNFIVVLLQKCFFIDSFFFFFFFKMYWYGN